jgi:hypothetical protein
MGPGAGGVASFIAERGMTVRNYIKGTQKSGRYIEDEARSPEMADSWGLDY